jgi:ubiquinone biosynthesis protein COQ9
MAIRTHLPRLRPLSKRIALPILRPYHSYDHPPPPGPFTPTESSILSAAIPHIPSHGFTHTTLSLGTKDAGYIDASTNLFPNGTFSLVHYHLYTQRLALAKHEHILSPALKEREKVPGVGWKVKALTWERLMANREIIHRWQEVCLHFSTSLNPVIQWIYVVDEKSL